MGGGGQPAMRASTVSLVPPSLPVLALSYEGVHVGLPPVQCAGWWRTDRGLPSRPVGGDGRQSANKLVGGTAGPHVTPIHRHDPVTPVGQGLTD